MSGDITPLKWAVGEDMKNMKTDMEEFARFLKRIGEREKAIPFMVKWVTQFFKENGLTPADNISYQRRKSFLLRLSQKVEPWQVEQAERALKILCRGPLKGPAEGRNREARHGPLPAAQLCHPSP